LRRAYDLDDKPEGVPQQTHFHLRNEKRTQINYDVIDRWRTGRSGPGASCPGMAASGTSI